MSKQRKQRKLTLKLLEYAESAKKNVKHWPHYENSFSVLSAQLSKTLSSAVIDSTWDSSHLENWEWDEFHEHFTFDVFSVFRMPQNGAYRPVRMSSGFHFDPRKDMSTELDRVSAEIKAYSDELLAMKRAYYNKKAHDGDAADA